MNVFSSFPRREKKAADQLTKNPEKQTVVGHFTCRHFKEQQHCSLCFEGSCAAFLGRNTRNKSLLYGVCQMSSFSHLQRQTDHLHPLNCVYVPSTPRRNFFFFGGGQLTWTSPGVRLSIERSAATGPVKNTTTDGKLSLKKKKESDRVALQPEHERQPQGFNDPNRRN